MQSEIFSGFFKELFTDILKIHKTLKNVTINCNKKETFYWKKKHQLKKRVLKCPFIIKKKSYVNLENYLI